MKTVRLGYTLLELMVVLVLLGLIAGLASLRLAPVWKEAQKRHAFEEILFAEEQFRDMCKRSQEQGFLVYELRPGGLTLKKGRDVIRTIKVSGGLELSGLMFGKGEIRDDGVFEVPVTPQGTTQSYAIRVNRTKNAEWIVFAGLTGQRTTLFREQDAKELFQTLRTYPD